MLSFTLSRWLRCLISREFPIRDVLLYWDYLLSGMDEGLREKASFERLYEDKDYSLGLDDPLINIDCFCVAMLVQIKPTRIHILLLI